MQPVLAKDLLFHQCLAESHVDAAFGLAFDEQRIKGASAVVRDPNFVELDFARDAVAMKLDNRRRKTISRRRTDSRAFEVARVLGRPIAAGSPERAVLTFRLIYRVSKADGAIMKARAAYFAVDEFEIIDRYFQRFARSVEEQGLELAARLYRSVARHYGDPARITAEIHGCQVRIGSQHSDVGRVDVVLFRDGVSQNRIRTLADVDGAAEH